MARGEVPLPVYSPTQKVPEAEQSEPAKATQVMPILAELVFAVFTVKPSLSSRIWPVTVSATAVKYGLFKTGIAFVFQTAPAPAVVFGFRRITSGLKPRPVIDLAAPLPM